MAEKRIALPDRHLFFPSCQPVIGAGMAGRSHAAGYRSVNTVFGEGLPPVRLAAIADANEQLARDAARRYGFEKAVLSWEEVVEDPSIDAISIVVGNALMNGGGKPRDGGSVFRACPAPQLLPSAVDMRAEVQALAQYQRRRADTRGQRRGHQG